MCKEALLALRAGKLGEHERRAEHVANKTMHIGVLCEMHTCMVLTLYLVLPEDVSGSTMTVIVQFRCCDACSSAKYSWVTCSSHDMHTDLNVLQTMATNPCELQAAALHRHWLYTTGG